MSVEYDALDAFELAIRILSYGDSVTVTDDTGPLKEEVLTRLKTQLSRSLHPPER